MPVRDICAATINQARASVPCWQSRDLLQEDNAASPQMHSLVDETNVSRQAQRNRAGADDLSRFRHNPVGSGDQSSHCKTMAIAARAA
jgi:hypothetical protein